MIYTTMYNTTREMDDDRLRAMGIRTRANTEHGLVGLRKTA